MQNFTSLSCKHHNLEIFKLPLNPPFNKYIFSGGVQIFPALYISTRLNIFINPKCSHSRMRLPPKSIFVHIRTQIRSPHHLKRHNTGPNLTFILPPKYLQFTHTHVKFSEIDSQPPNAAHPPYLPYMQTA